METTRPLRGAGRSKGEGGGRMEVAIKGEAKEIAALVLELQERRGEELPNYIPASSSRDGVRERG